MNFKKIILASAAAASLFISSISLALSDTSGHWAEKNIDVLAGEGIINGYEDGSFKPDSYITRAEVSKLIWHMNGGLSESYISDFSDVSSSDWSCRYIASLSDDGIISGYSDGTFRPNNFITRAEFSKMAAASLEDELTEDSKSFSDSSGHWAEDYIGMLAGNLLINGYGDGSFKPDSYITRAEVSTVIAKALNLAERTEAPAVPSTPEYPTENTFEAAYVTKVSDGDTITVNLNGTNYKLRMIGVDTPESVHPDKSRNTACGKAASDYTKSRLTAGTEVYLQKDVSDTDRYGRLLRYVWVERPSSNEPSESEIAEKMYNAELVINGYARPATFAPDVKYADLFRRFAADARENSRGLWEYSGDCSSFIAKDSYYDNSSSEGSEYTEPNNGGSQGGEEAGSTEYPGFPAGVSGKAHASVYSGRKIIGNKDTKKYHRFGQRYYDSVYVENAVLFDNASDAEAAGYVAAKR